MLKLKLVKVNNEDEAAATSNRTANVGYVNYGTKFLKELLDTWEVKGERVVAADSYFTYVQSEKELNDMGLGLIGVFEQASRQYPMAHIQRK